MEARCGSCEMVKIYPRSQWSWVRYKGSSRDKMVCPVCRREAEAQMCNILSPPAPTAEPCVLSLSGSSG